MLRKCAAHARYRSASPHAGRPKPYYARSQTGIMGAPISSWPAPTVHQLWTVKGLRGRVCMATQGTLAQIRARSELCLQMSPSKLNSRESSATRG
jgi:hypothetical protein